MEYSAFCPTLNGLCIQTNAENKALMKLNRVILCNSFLCDYQARFDDVSSVMGFFLTERLPPSDNMEGWRESPGPKGAEQTRTRMGKVFIQSAPHNKCFDINPTYSSQFKSSLLPALRALLSLFFIPFPTYH